MKTAKIPEPLDSFWVGGMALNMKAYQEIVETLGEIAFIKDHVRSQ